MNVHGMLPKWISDFAEGFSKKETMSDIENIKQEIIAEVENTEQEKVAIININDLPKVPWHDETFYALIDPDKKTAILYNEFQNEVHTIENVSTIEEVNDYLNKNEVVAEEEIELEKTSDEESLPPELNCSDGEPENLPESSDTWPGPNEGIKESLEDQINKVSSIMELTEKIAILENKLSDLSSEITAMKAQEYARINPEGIYSMDVPKAENEHFEETAKKTEEKINADNAVDITTMEGRVSLPEVQKTIAESYEVPSDEVDKMSYNRDENIKKLNSQEVDLFKTAICPNCNGELIKANNVKNIAGIYCSNCNTEYAVNLDDEQIYQKII